MLPSAKDLMETHVLSVDPEASLLDVHRLFVEEQISGAPVVDERGLLLGVISTTDLMRAVDEERDTAIVDAEYFRDILPYTTPDWATSGEEDFQDRLRERRVTDVMTRGLIAVAPGADAAEIARVLREHRIHRVFVVEDQNLLGVISAFDVLRVLEELKGP
jgi:CBS domain-containing protein